MFLGLYACRTKTQWKLLFYSTDNQVFLSITCPLSLDCLIFLAPHLDSLDKEESIASLSRVTPPEGAATSILSPWVWPLVTSNSAINSVMDRRGREEVLPDGARIGHLYEEYCHHGHDYQTLQGHPVTSLCIWYLFNQQVNSSTSQLLLHCSTPHLINYSTAQVPNCLNA